METQWLEWLEIASLLGLFGVFSGLLAGLLGVGGGIVLVPALFFVLAPLELTQWPMHVSVATSLANILLTGSRSALAHHHRGNVDWSVVKIYGPSIALGAIIGTVLTQFFSSAELQLLFAVIAAILGIILLIRPVVLREGLPSNSIIVPTVSGFGCISALVGIGGGSLVVPSLVSFGFPIIKAIGSASAIGVFIAFPAVIGFVWMGHGQTSLPNFSLGYIWLPGLVLTSITSVLMAPLGSKIASNLPSSLLRGIFGVFLMIIAMNLGLDAYDNL